MKLRDAYPVSTDPARLVFRFISQGPKGRIDKLLEFTPTGGYAGGGEIYNLALGDLGPDGELDDQPVTNNGDTQRVLLTVAAAVYTFTEQYPKLVVLVEGGTPARTRLYQMGIANNFDEIQQSFEVYGLVENQWQVFQKGVTYAAFLVRRNPPQQ